MATLDWREGGKRVDDPARSDLPKDSRGFDVSLRNTGLLQCVLG